MLEFQIRYSISFSPDDLSAMHAYLFYVSFAGLDIGLGIVLGLGTAGLGRGLVRGGFDYTL